MNRTFIEIKLFQVKPDKLDQFKRIVERMSNNQLFKIGQMTYLNKSRVKAAFFFSYWRTTSIDLFIEMRKN